MALSENLFGWRRRRRKRRASFVFLFFLTKRRAIRGEASNTRRTQTPSLTSRGWVSQVFYFKAPNQTVNKHQLLFLTPSCALFSISTKEDQFGVSIQPAVGELLMPSTMTEQDFCKEQGRGRTLHHRTSLQSFMRPFVGKVASLYLNLLL